MDSLNSLALLQDDMSEETRKQISKLYSDLRKGHTIFSTEGKTLPRISMSDLVKKEDIEKCFKNVATSEFDTVILDILHSELPYNNVTLGLQLSRSDKHTTLTPTVIKERFNVRKIEG